MRFERAAKPSSRSGFTLVELLVVLAILSVTVALAAPRLENALQASQLKATARGLLVAATKARRMARNQGLEIALQIDVAKATFQLHRNPAQPIRPKNVRVVVTGAQSEATSGHRMAIRFFPDGSATGGRIVLQHREQRLIMNVDWLTGIARLEP